MFQSLYNMWIDLHTLLALYEEEVFEAKSGTSTTPSGWKRSLYLFQILLLLNDRVFCDIYSFWTTTGCKLIFQVHKHSATWCTVLCSLSVLKWSLTCQQNPPCYTQINLTNLGSRLIRKHTSFLCLYLLVCFFFFPLVFINFATLGLYRIFLYMWTCGQFPLCPQDWSIYTK